MLVKGGRLERLGHFLVEAGDYFVDCLLPRLLLVSLVIDCIEKVPQRFFDHLSEDLWELVVGGRGGEFGFGRFGRVSLEEGELVVWLAA